MRPRLLPCLLFTIVAVSAASDVVAQTQQLVKEVVRKFPEGSCPLDTDLIGTFVTDTGIIQLTFAVGLGSLPDVKSGVIAVGFSQVLDDISIIEAAEFEAHQQDDPGNCYFDSDPPVPVYTGSSHTFLESFDPPTSPCPWDETDGFTISDGAIRFTGATDFGSTSVIISGLTPGTQYVIHGSWFAEGFPFALDCTDPASLCMQITVDDLPNGCGPLPAENKTWGGVKALYQD